MSSDGSKPSRQDEAAAWFAAERAGAMLVEQRAAFDAWRADPRNQMALDAMRELWDDLAVLKGAPPRSAARRRSPLAVAAAVAIGMIVVGAAALSWLGWPGDTAIRTVAGQQQTQSLPDGSLIAVNVASDVSYAIRDNSRVVKISDGEAAFTVRPDAARPFVVRAGDFEIRAVGTVFNVRQRDGTIDVSVSEGAVQICRATGKDAGSVLANLGAGQMLQFPAAFSAETFSSRSTPIPPEQVAEWRMRVVTYEDAAIRDVLADFNRYFDQKLEADDPDLLERHVTIRLRVDDRDRAIETLAGLLQVRVQKTERGEVLVELARLKPDAQ